ncbi:hypothetical protein Alsa3_CDS0165 [Staphylococcus phage Alsa_3]|nr:hypothetical protein Alsa3_CDS0165 [Staphylococcus phage Alsa_3]WNM51290.1 hypothetical protein Alsa4_CDS0160 [Staphylococcus phage Alsa_4]
METAYTQAIKSINTIFTGNQDHIQRGNKLFIKYLQVEENRMLRKFNGKEDRLDLKSLEDSLHLILNYMDIEISEVYIQDRLVRKQIVRIANVLLESIKYDSL